MKGTVLLAASLVPPPAPGTCEAGGSGFINALDAFTGTGLSAPYFDVNNDGKYDDQDKMTDADGNLVASILVAMAVASYDFGATLPGCSIDVTDHYAFGFASGEPTNTTYEIEAVPQGRQAPSDTDCGTLSLDNTGVRGAGDDSAGAVDTCW